MKKNSKIYTVYLKQPNKASDSELSKTLVRKQHALSRARQILSQYTQNACFSANLLGYIHSRTKPKINYIRREATRTIYERLDDDKQNMKYIYFFIILFTAITIALLIKIKVM